MASLPYPRTHSDNLPQNSRNTQNLLLRYPPTEYAEYTEPSAKKFSHRFRGTQILLIRSAKSVGNNQRTNQNKHTHQGVQRSPLHRPNSQYKTTKAEALTFALVLFSPSAPTDADIRTDRRRHPHRPTQTSAPTDATSEDVTYACRKIVIRLIKIGNTAYSNIS